MSYLTTNEYIPEHFANAIGTLVSDLRNAFPGMYENSPLQPTLCVVEEAGEFAGAMRRFIGLARRPGTKEEAEDECADVIISALVAAYVSGLDIETALPRKFAKIFSRGYHA